MKIFLTKGCDHPSSGFSLTELAIVLLVFGAILAGIFSAYIGAHNRTLVNQGSDQLGIIATNIQTLYTSQNLSSLALPGTFTGNAATTATFINLNGNGNDLRGIFPPEMLNGGNTVTDPWGGNVFVGLIRPTLPPYAGLPLFVIEYKNVPTAACASFVAMNSTPGRDTGLVQIVLTNSANTATTFSSSAQQLPVATTALVNNCTDAGAPYTIDWYYKVGNGCVAGTPC